MEFDGTVPPLPRLDRGHFDRPDGTNGFNTIHGRSHTLRVWIHATEIAEQLGVSSAEREALHHAALWHDIGRTHDGADYYHGAKSAGKVIGRRLHEGVDGPVLDMALAAVTHHSGSEEHGERAMAWAAEPIMALRVFRILKDADGLDRVRLGDLDPSYLRLDVSRRRIDRAWELLVELP